RKRIPETRGALVSRAGLSTAAPNDAAVESARQRGHRVPPRPAFRGSHTCTPHTSGAPERNPADPARRIRFVALLSLQPRWTDPCHSPHTASPRQPQGRFLHKQLVYNTLP